MQLYYDVHDGTGPYLLLVHGFLSSRTQWRLNLAAVVDFVAQHVLSDVSSLTPRESQG